MSNIIYFGDSYCASYDPRTDNPPVFEGVVYTRGVDTHLNLAADQLGLSLLAFGYAGRSWFYSRFRMLTELARHPTIISECEAMIFFHSDPFRFNTIEEYINTGLMHDYNPRPEKEKPFIQPYRQWLVDLMDARFQEWAQQQWFLEINRLWPNVKKIHFNNFEATVDSTVLLNGMVFTTPLLTLSTREFSNNSSIEFQDKICSFDNRHNHFNGHNNQALANVVVDAVRNYKVGRYQIDTSLFK